MKTTFKSLSESDKQAVTEVARRMHATLGTEFWDEVDRVLNENAAKKAPKVLPRLTNSPKRGT